MTLCVCGVTVVPGAGYLIPGDDNIIYFNKENYLFQKYMPMISPLDADFSQGTPQSLVCCLSYPGPLRQIVLSSDRGCCSTLCLAKSCLHSRTRLLNSYCSEMAKSILTFVLVEKLIKYFYFHISNSLLQWCL